MKGEAIQIAEPKAGFYTMRLVRGGPRVPVRIWFGHAVIDGEEQDRGVDWRCEIAGRTDRYERDEDTGYRCRVALPIDRAWPFCAGTPITEGEYRYMLDLAEWARTNAPSHPAANPNQRVDLGAMAPIF